LNLEPNLLAFAALDDLFHGLQANIDECGLPRRHGSEPPLDGFAHLTRFFNSLTVTSKALIIVEYSGQGTIWSPEKLFDLTAQPSG